MRSNERTTAVLLVSCALAVGCSKHPFRVPSWAMYPSILPGDHVMADSGVKVPSRGDIFVFDYPERPEQAFVKRIVGLPGDRVEIKGRVLTINGTALRTCAIGPHSYTDETSAHAGDFLLESNGTVAYIVFYDKNGGTDGTWVVKPDQYFTMGDNRNNSHDSRMWFGGVGGGVPSDMLRGKTPSSKLTLPKDAASLEPALAKCKTELGVTGT
jgi:signal peptidase I